MWRPLSERRSPDRRLALVHAPALDASVSAPRPQSGATFRRRLADASYLFLMSLGWFGLNVLAAAGCAVVAFAVLGGGDWAATFLQIDNLTSRYLEADAGRRAQFQHHLVQAFTLIIIALLICRLPRFVKRMRRELAEAPGQ